MVQTRKWWNITQDLVPMKFMPHMSMWVTVMGMGMRLSYIIGLEWPLLQSGLANLEFFWFWHAFRSSGNCWCLLNFKFCNLNPHGTTLMSTTDKFSWCSFFSLEWSITGFKTVEWVFELKNSSLKSFLKQSTPFIQIIQLLRPTTMHLRLVVKSMRDYNHMFNGHPINQQIF